MSEQLEAAGAAVAAAQTVVDAACQHLARASTEQLLKESGLNPPLRVLLSPAQHEQLMESGGAQLAWFRDHRLDLAADARVQHGGCLLESPRGIIDGRFEVQLEKLREIVAGHYAGATR